VVRPVTETTNRPLPNRVATSTMGAP